MASSFLERLRSGPPICADGGMGTLLASAVPRLRCPEEANLRSPQSVVDLHLGFIRAGAELIETNTFGANRRKLAAHFLEQELEQINSAGVKLARDAREVSGRPIYIAGSIGPLGDVGDAEDERSQAFAEQAAVLEGRGVDLFTVETFYDLAELEQAIEAVRSVSSLPIVALLTFDEDAETLAGVAARTAAERLRELGVAAMGANHGAGLQAALTALEQMAGDGPPLAALPNLGLASLAGGRVIFPHATPEYFAEFAAQARSLGAGIIGGCCGTTPSEIAAIRGALDEERVPSAPLEVVERDAGGRFADAGSRGDARSPATSARVVSWSRCRSTRRSGGDYAGCSRPCEAIRESGAVGYVDINDNATASAKLSAMIMASAIERRLGVETIPHLTSRDYSIMGLEALLLGGHAEGVRNILAVTGDPPEVGDYPGSTGIYEVDAIGLTQLIAHLNAGQNYNGKLDRLGHLVLHRRRRQSDGGRSRAGGRPLSAQAGGRRAVRDDADLVRPALPRRVPGADRRHLADPRDRRPLPACRRTGSPSGCTTRCRESSCRMLSRRRCATPVPGLPRSARPMRGSSSASCVRRPTASTSRRRFGARWRRSMSS